MSARPGLDCAIGTSSLIATLCVAARERLPRRRELLVGDGGARHLDARFVALRELRRLRIGGDHGVCRTATREGDDEEDEERDRADRCGDDCPRLGRHEGETAPDGAHATRRRFHGDDGLGAGDPDGARERDARGVRAAPRTGRGSVRRQPEREARRVEQLAGVGEATARLLGEESRHDCLDLLAGRWPPARPWTSEGWAPSPACRGA